jgi:hypothetical protein
MNTRPPLLPLLSGLIFWAVSLPCPAADEDGVYMLTNPEHSREEIEKALSEMPAVKYTPPADRWSRLPRTAATLKKGEGALNIVMLGDSIVNDTSRSRWDDLVQEAYPKVRITRVTVVRGGTGCWWYREPGRIEKYVLPHRPDLLIIGGISQRDDIDSIREVIHQVRAARPCDVLLMSGAFGPVDPRDDTQWSYEIPPGEKDYRRRLKALADATDAAFLDMTAAWGRYIRDSGKELDFFKRDPIHANIRGEQVLGHILAGYFAPTS